MLKRFCGRSETYTLVFTFTLQVVPRNDTSTRTCVINFIWYYNIFAFFTNLHEKYRFFLYLKRQGKFDVSSEDPLSGSNFHQKVEFVFVVSGSERSYTFRVFLNALCTYTDNVKSR